MINTRTEAVRALNANVRYVNRCLELKNPISLCRLETYHINIRQWHIRMNTGDIPCEPLIHVRNLGVDIPLPWIRVQTRYEMISKNIGNDEEKYILKPGTKFKLNFFRICIEGVIMDVSNLDHKNIEFYFHELEYTTVVSASNEPRDRKF